MWARSGISSYCKHHKQIISYNSLKLLYVHAFCLIVNEHTYILVKKLFTLLTNIWKYFRMCLKYYGKCFIWFFAWNSALFIKWRFHSKIQIYSSWDVRVCFFQLFRTCIICSSQKMAETITHNPCPKTDRKKYTLYITSHGITIRKS